MAAIGFGVPAATTMSTFRSGARPEVDDVVGSPNRFFIVFDDDDGVAEIAKFLKRGQQPRIVFVMEANRRLVENVQHTAKSRTDLRREPDALALAAGQRVGSPIQAQVVQSDGVEEFEPIPNFTDDPVCDQPFSRAQLQIRKETESFPRSATRRFPQSTFPRHEPPDFPASGACLAGRARPRDHEAGEIFRQRVLPVVLTVQKIDDSRHALSPLLDAVERWRAGPFGEAVQTAAEDRRRVAVRSGVPCALRARHRARYW